MKADTELAFKSNPNKDYLRSVYDKALIRAWQQARGARLQYLGLPGPEMLDVIEWQDHLDRFSTIERRENEQHLLFLRAHVRDVEHRLHSLYGEFDKILLTGRDVYGQSPRWPYDIVNLDYFGGFLYQDMARPRALSKLISNQDEYERSFLLIITHDLRDGDFVGEKMSFFDSLGRALTRDYGSEQVVRTFVEAYKDPMTTDAARQAVYVNSFLRDAGEMAHFRVRARPAITYIGTGGTKMIHYTTDFQHDPSQHRAVSEQSLIELLNLGFCELKNGEFHPVAAPTLPELR